MSSRRSRRAGSTRLTTVEAVEQILSEFPVGDGGFEVDMRGGDDADIDFDVLAAADARDGFFLQDAEEFRLRAHGEFADFVEEKRALIGLLEAADAARVGPGEGAFFVAEEFALEQRPRGWRRS